MEARSWEELILHGVCLRCIHSASWAGTLPAPDAADGVRSPRWREPSPQRLPPPAPSDRAVVRPAGRRCPLRRSRWISRSRCRTRAQTLAERSRGRCPLAPAPRALVPRAAGRRERGPCLTVVLAAGSAAGRYPAARPYQPRGPGAVTQGHQPDQLSGAHPARVHQRSNHGW